MYLSIGRLCFNPAAPPVPSTATRRDLVAGAGLDRASFAAGLGALKERWSEASARWIKLYSPPSVPAEAGDGNGADGAGPSFRVETSRDKG